LVSIVHPWNFGKAVTTKHGKEQLTSRQLTTAFAKALAGMEQADKSETNSNFQFSNVQSKNY
jgi:hypothetical protein